MKLDQERAGWLAGSSRQRSNNPVSQEPLDRDARIGSGLPGRGAQHRMPEVLCNSEEQTIESRHHRNTFFSRACRR